MSAFNECDLIKWDKFIGGEYNTVLEQATFKSRSKNKDHNFKTCDLIITADTETSHSFPGSSGEEAFYYEAPELEYLKEAVPLLKQVYGEKNPRYRESAERLSQLEPYVSAETLTAAGEAYISGKKTLPSGDERRRDGI